MVPYQNLIYLFALIGNPGEIFDRGPPREQYLNIFLYETSESFDSKLGWYVS